MNKTEFLKVLQTNESAKSYLCQIRWPDGKPYCPHCGSGKVYAIANGKRYECGEKPCLKRFSVTCGTIFHGSKISYQKQLYLLFVLFHEDGNTRKTSIKLGVTQKTSWLWYKKIKEKINNMNNQDPIVAAMLNILTN